MQPRRQPSQEILASPLRARDDACDSALTPTRRETRREFLWRAGGGLGGIALASLLCHERLLAAPGLLSGGLHHAPRAKRVVQLYMSGAASQCDTFDFKPQLIARNGEAWDPGEKVELFQSTPGAVMQSPWSWRPRRPAPS